MKNFGSTAKGSSSEIGPPWLNAEEIPWVPRSVLICAEVV